MFIAFSIVSLVGVAAASAAHPLRGVTGRQGLALVLVTTALTALPVLLIRYAEARQLGLFAIIIFCLTGVLSWLISPGIVLLFRYLFGHKTPLPPPPARTESLPEQVHSASQGSHWLEFLLVATLLVLVAAIVLVRVLKRERPSAPVVRRLRPPPEPEQVRARDLYSLLDDSLEDLRREPDPRKAVIAAYSRMERGLGKLGIEHDAADTPFECLARVLEALAVSAPAAGRLTDLFERAEFSQAPIADETKSDAIEALLAVREEARACAV